MHLNSVCKSEIINTYGHRLLSMIVVNPQVNPRISTDQNKRGKCGTPVCCYKTHFPQEQYFIDP